MASALSRVPTELWDMIFELAAGPSLLVAHSYLEEIKFRSTAIGQQQACGNSRKAFLQDRVLIFGPRSVSERDKTGF